jgi:uncharacterized protein (DUF952 family)
MHGFRNRHLKKMCSLEVEGGRRYGRLSAPAIESRDWASTPHRKQLIQPNWKSGRLRTIYKICPASSWREAERQGTYRGSADDARDGFIHFSTAAQLPETLRKYYFGQTGLFLVAVDAGALGDDLRWEPSRGGDLFPHLYGELDLGAVTAVMDLRARSDGNHDIPELKS